MMKTLNYQGFTKPCSCQYAVADLSGKKVVVFVQGNLTNTSITNMIEVLASRVLATDLAGVNPGEVRFFEYYPRNLQPLREWQEVEFDEYLPLEGRKRGLLAKILEAVRGPVAPSSWAVDGPQWHALNADDVPFEVRRIVT